MFPLSKWIGIAKIAAIIGLLSYGLVTLNSYRKDRVELQEQVATELAAKLSAQATAQELQNANILLVDAMRVQEESIKRMEARLETMNQEFTALRQVRESEKAIFDEHEFGRLTKAKPGLIEKLANEATAERFERFESIINGG